MQKLSPSQFNALLEEQRDASRFSELTEQTAFLLGERFDRAILLSYCGYAVTYESLLSLTQKLAAVGLFLAQNHEMAVQLRQTLTPFAERALLASVDALATGVQVGVRELQGAIQYVQINKASLKNLPQLSRHACYLTAASAYSEQLRVVFCGLFGLCELQNAVLLAMSRGPCRLVENLQKSPEIFRTLANCVFQAASKAVFAQQLQSFEFLLEQSAQRSQKAGSGQNAAIHIIFMQAFAMASASQSPAARRNAATILQFFPLQYNNANATLAELGFLQRALGDDVVEVRAEAALQSAGVLLACGDASVQFDVLGGLVSCCFDAALGVRRAALTSTLRLVERGHAGCIQIIVGNMVSFKSLLKDVTVISVLSARLYAQLMADGKIPPDQEIFSVLNNSRFSAKMTLQVLFPGGENGFVQAPKVCFEQLFLGCQKCPEMIVGVLQQYIQSTRAGLATATAGKVAVISSICAVCAAVFIEVPDQSLLQVIADGNQQLLRLRCYYSAYQPSRGAEEALKSALSHVAQAVASDEFQKQLSACWARQRDLPTLLACLSLHEHCAKQIMTAEDAEQCDFRLTDAALRCISRFYAQEALLKWLGGEKVRYYMGIAHKICAAADGTARRAQTKAKTTAKEQADDDCWDRPLYAAFEPQPSPARLAEAFESVSNYQQTRVSVWDLIALLTEFIYQSTKDQAANRCFLLLKCADFDADPHRDDAATLLTLAADIYLNIRHFSLSAEAAEALCAFVDAVIARQFQDQACALVASRLGKDVVVSPDAFQDDERGVVQEILSQRTAV